MRYLILICISLFFQSCNSIVRTSLNINKSINPTQLSINGSYSDGFNRFYLYSNNIMIRYIVGDEFNIENYKKHKEPYGYGWYFIDGNKITLQYYVSAEGPPYVVVVYDGKIVNGYKFIIDSERQLSASLMGKNEISRKKVNNEYLFKKEVKPDSINPWVPIDSISYQNALNKNIWRKKFNGYK